jgi:4'-phosphopantetheinyl transferase
MKDNLESVKQSVAIWNIFIPDHRAEALECRDLLTDDELERAEKLVKPGDSGRFILCRGLLRRILADYLQTDPCGLRFSRNPQGKPFLENSGLEFNLSHSHDRLLIAVTAGRAVGVDIEFRRSGLNMESIAKRWFAPEEQAFFQALENPEEGFFEIWSKKEAYVKALGLGIYQELNTFAVPLGESPFFPVLGCCDAPGGCGESWFFQTLEIDSSYAAALVSQAPAVPVILRTLTS